MRSDRPWALRATKASLRSIPLSRSRSGLAEACAGAGSRASSRATAALPALRCRLSATGGVIGSGAGLTTGASRCVRSSTPTTTARRDAPAFRAGALGTPYNSDVRDLLAVPAGVAERVRVGLRALEEEVQVVLPGEADAAVDLQRAARDVDRRVGRVGLGAVGRHVGVLGVVVERPRRPVGDRARALGLEEHLRAGVRDGLVGADRAAELLALLGVLDRGLRHARGDADGLGGGHHRDRVPGAAEVAGQLRRRARRRASR